ncbi:TPM domain-containing protein [Aciduricibacillus chroicocephali]|uniref:TPM domain-containing protein n=1 Tax=Aciduricibacillus chroicocephali TaxID=3054939 RepID=A0ABY9L198_9BACI|nr:TPM domain-containing protein [Bacillaceae bacterium 44XB]
MVSYSQKFAAFLVLMLVFLVVLPFGNKAEAAKQRVFDYGNLLSSAEKQKLEDSAAEYSSKRKIDFYIVTHVREQVGSQKAQIIMEDFYSEVLKAKGNAAILSYIDDVPGKKDLYIGGYKKAEKSLNNNRINTLLDKIVPYLAEDEYAKGFEKYLDLAYEYSGIRFGLNPESILFKTWFQLLIACSVAGIVLWIMLRDIGGKVTVSGATYRDAGQSKLLGKEDRYITTTVTRVRKPESNDNNNFGGGGMSGGGPSHSGGGRRF